MPVPYRRFWVALAAGLTVCPRTPGGPEYGYVGAVVNGQGRGHGPMRCSVLRRAGPGSEGGRAGRGSGWPRSWTVRGSRSVRRVAPVGWDDTARHQVNRARVERGRQAREDFEENRPATPAVRAIDRSVEFLDLVTACHAFVAASGRVVPGPRDRRLGRERCTGARDARLDRDGRGHREGRRRRGARQAPARRMGGAPRLQAPVGGIPRTRRHDPVCPLRGPSGGVDFPPARAGERADRQPGPRGPGLPPRHDRRAGPAPPNSRHTNSWSAGRSPPRSAGSPDGLGTARYVPQPPAGEEKFAMATRRCYPSGTPARGTSRKAPPATASWPAGQRPASSDRSATSSANATSSSTPRAARCKGLTPALYWVQDRTDSTTTSAPT